MTSSCQTKDSCSYHSMSFSCCVSSVLLWRARVYVYGICLCSPSCSRPKSSVTDVTGSVTTITLPPKLHCINYVFWMLPLKCILLLTLSSDKQETHNSNPVHMIRTSQFYRTTNKTAAGYHLCMALCRVYIWVQICWLTFTQQVIIRSNFV